MLKHGFQKFLNFLATSCSSFQSSLDVNLRGLIVLLFSLSIPNCSEFLPYGSSRLPLFLQKSLVKVFGESCVTGLHFRVASTLGLLQLQGCFNFRAASKVEATLKCNPVTHTPVKQCEIFADDHFCSVKFSFSRQEMIL